MIALWTSSFLPIPVAGHRDELVPGDAQPTGSDLFSLRDLGMDRALPTPALGRQLFVDDTAGAPGPLRPHDPNRLDRRAVGGVVAVRLEVVRQIVGRP